MELTSPLNVENATRKTKPSIISPVNVQQMTENGNAKLLWDYSIRTDRVITAHQPDLTLVDKTVNIVLLIDVAVPWDSRAEQNEQERKEINTKT